MADQYGPMFIIRLGGNRRGLVVNSWEMAKECYRTNDVAFSNRPRTAALRLMSYNFAMSGFSSYGPYWREMRKIAVLRLLSARKVAALGGMREAQILSVMRSLNAYCCDYSTEKGATAPVDMREFCGDLTLGLMVRTVAGEVEGKMGSPERLKWRRTIRQFFTMMTVFTVSDALPFLGWMDCRFGGTQRALRKTGRSFDAILHGWLEEHKKQKELTAGNYGGGGKEDDDFMCEMLDVANGPQQEGRCSRTPLRTFFVWWRSTRLPCDPVHPSCVVWRRSTHLPCDPVHPSCVADHTGGVLVLPI